MLGHSTVDCTIAAMRGFLLTRQHASQSLSLAWPIYAYSMYNMCIHIYIDIHTHTCICMYTYIYIYIRIHLCFVCFVCLCTDFYLFDATYCVYIICIYILYILYYIYYIYMIHIYVHVYSCLPLLLRSPHSRPQRRPLAGLMPGSGSHPEP